MALQFLCIDDDEVIRVLMPRIVRRSFPDAEVIACPTVPQALAVLASTTVDCILMDYYVHGQCALEIIDAAHAALLVPTVIIVASIFDIHVAYHIARSGCDAIISKPFSLRTFNETLTRLVPRAPVLGPRVF